MNIYEKYKEYWQTEEGKLTQRKFDSSEKRKKLKFKYQQSEKGKEQHKKDSKIYRDKYPQKEKAHKIVYNAVKTGKLIKQPCEKCGELKAEAHHDDYNKPLEVNWLCRICHRRFHRNIIIHNTASIDKHAYIGDGTKIWNNAQVREGAVIGCNCVIGTGVYIGKNVTVGNDCKIENYACLFQGVKLGNNVFIGPMVCFTNDKYPKVKEWSENKITKTIVKDDVSIGANSTIICGVILGAGVMIGAGSVVTNAIWNGIAYGNPTRVVRTHRRLNYEM